MPSPDLQRLMARVDVLSQRFHTRPAPSAAPAPGNVPARQAAAPRGPDFRSELARASSQARAAKPASEATPAPAVSPPAVLARVQETPAIPPASLAADGDGAPDIVALAKTQTGKPYRWGGGRGDASAFDCSSFVTWVYRQAGHDLPAFTDAAFAATVAADSPQPGDLVFFRYDDPHQPGVRYPHTGIYAGDNAMIDAAVDGGVQMRPLRPDPIFRRWPDPAGATPAPATVAAVAPAAAPARASGPERAELAALVASAAGRHGLDPGLATALVQAESGFNPRAVSPAGAKGLMQLMDGTARGLGIADPFDPDENVQGGLRYLRSLFDRYGGDPRLALAAYNAGPGAVDRHGGVPPYPETQRYVARVLGAWERDRHAP